ncbi:MAG: hypothetical protein Q8P31_11275 [Bacillota bacterium]|nr:hypothetical protein [Bacillota bacterium]
MALSRARDSGGSGLQTRSTVSDQSFFTILGGMATRNVRHVPRALLKNWAWMAALSVLWLVLMTYGLPVIGSVLVFLTAAYATFVGKALYLSIVHSTVIPRLAQIRRSGIGEVAGKYKQTLGVTGRAFSLLGGKESLRVLLLFGGAGIAFSNLVTRNNATDKYFICVLAAGWLLDTLSLGAGSMPIRLFQAGYRDVAKRSASFELVYAAFASFAVGLALGFVPGLFGRSYWDYKGYILGAVCIAGSLVLGSVGSRNAKRQA